jgi:aldehyde dehydrogenase (NAD+)
VAPVQLDRIRGLVDQGRSEGAEIWQPSWSEPEEGWFYPPTLCTNVSSASTIAREEIFGPVVVMMSFRTPEEAVELANDTRYGLAASVWSENINQALHVAPRIKAGTVWINCTNLFDAAAGFGGYRESGFGREGGREGLREYVEPAWHADRQEKPAEWADPEVPGEGAGVDPADAAARDGAPDGEGAGGPGEGGTPPLDRTPKMYIGGRQPRPDAEYVLPVLDPGGRRVGEVGRGNRKDVRNAVEAARAAEGWAGATAHNRAQVLYFVAENLDARAGEFARRITSMTGADPEEARREVELSVDRLFHWAAWADKHDGDVHRTPFRNVTFAIPEPIGVMGVVCPTERPLLGFVSTAIPPVALGNRVVAVPSQRWPLAATDFYQVLDTSDVPGGALNIVTGVREELTEVLAAHDSVDGMWYFGSREGSERVERLSTGNLKRTWVDRGMARDWADPDRGAGPEFLREATQVKNIWVPYGE